MKAFSSVAAAAVLALGAIGSAQALTLTAGNYKITFDNYDSGTLYGSLPGPKCIMSVAACNAAASPPAPGSVGSVNPGSDTMGIVSVALIQNITNGQVEFSKGTASSVGGVAVGPFLTGVFGNLSDRTVSVSFDPFTGLTTTTALAEGGGFRLFSNAADWNPTLGSTGGGDLNAYTYAGISTGTLFLAGDFAPGVVAVDPMATYLTQYSNQGVSGNGQGYLNFSGGAAQAFFDTNSLTTNLGTQADAFLTTTFDNANGALPADWTVKSTGQVSGLLAVPEPGSLALVSLAVLALGVSARVRNKA